MDRYDTQAQNYITLVDDDETSATKLISMLLAHGAPSVSLQHDKTRYLKELKALLTHHDDTLPSMIIVDFKGFPAAAAAFVSSIRALPGAQSLLIAAMADDLSRPVRDVLLNAGANAVFARQSTTDGFRCEAAELVSFWVRNQRLEAVGT